MTMRQPTENHKRLEKLCGNWHGEETMHPSPWSADGGTANGKLETRLGLGGFYIVSEYTQTRDGQVAFVGHGVYGYDTADDRYTMYWFDSTGVEPTPPGFGKWEGDTLMFERSHGSSASRYVYKIISDDEYRFEIKNCQDGQEWKTFMEATYRRS